MSSSQPTTSARRARRQPVLCASAAWRLLWAAAALLLLWAAIGWALD